GGASSRFWPMDDQPKYLLKPDAKTSLLELAYARCASLTKNIYAVTAEQQSATVQAILPKLKATQVLSEPERRDTLAAVTLALETIARDDPQAIVIVTAADSFYSPNECFNEPVKLALDKGVFEEGTLCCFGVRPTRPETGFGYIQQGEHLGPGMYRAKAFIEKPDIELAKAYVASAGYFWNCGSFAWKASGFLTEVKRQQPELLDGVRAYLDAGNESERRKSYAALPATSVDYGVMEGARHVAVLEVDAAFDDIGTWDALAALGQLDLHRDHALFVDANRCISVSPGTVAFVGVENLIVVQHGDKTLVMKRGAGNRVKEAHRLDQENKA
ncbi:MAG: NTP transferase domain-containing protein, partial [Planctomycetes bacterium]|nr:NTP transferase domain-containing protein [Planctomycetota bacterium]